MNKAVLKVHFAFKHSSVHLRKISTGLGCGKISWQHWDKMLEDVEKQFFFQQQFNKLCLAGSLDYF